MGPGEREAYLASLIEQQKIVSAPVKSTIGSYVIEDKKSAKKQITILTKEAKIIHSKKEFEKAIEMYRDAAIIASNWELSKEFILLEEILRTIKIEELTVKKKDVEFEAKDFLKQKNYPEAARKFKEASKVASEIFKLGVTNMTKEVKKLTNKANELERKK
jgi:hypothetical protein